MNPKIRPPPNRTTELVIRNLFITQNIEFMAKSKFAIKEIKPDEKGVKYILEMDGIKNIGNRYAFSEEELNALWLTITRVLDTTKK